MPSTSPDTAKPNPMSVAPKLMAEGFLGEVFVSLTGGIFLTGAALELGAGPVGLSALATLPLMTQVFQLASPSVQRWVGSRRRAVVGAFVVARLLWLVPVVLLLLRLSGPGAVGLAAVAIMAMGAISMVGANAWMTWVADLVPSEARARVFGRRAWAVALATLLAAPAGAVLVDQMRERGQANLALAALGIVAVVAGVLAPVAMARLPSEPLPPLTPMRATVRRLAKRKSFRRLIGLFALWSAAVGLPSPFWTLYMLEHLDMSFFLIITHTVVVLSVRLLTNRLWIPVIERQGSVRVLIGCGAAIAFIPLLWLIPRAGMIWPLYVEAVVSGLVWTGFNQAALIQPLAVLAVEDRSRGLALFNVATGSAHFVAALLGGLILELVGVSGEAGFYALFVTSALLRAGTAALSLRITEPGMSFSGFAFQFVGNGILRRSSITRPWLPGDTQTTEPATEPAAGEPSEDAP
jgi:predicted MFS family arabinose efflux permease